MKIGIATINLEYLLGNYGSLFQHFALRKIITSFGVTPVRLSETREYVNFVKQQILRGLIFFVFFWLKNRRIRRIRRTFIKKRMFRLFYAKNIGKIAENNRVCWDCLLAGSDQVWYEADEKNFLISYPDKIRRVSYAASCNWSVAEQDENWQKVAKRAFEKYSLISVREDSALPFLKKIVPDGIRLSCVLDPVLLLRREEYIALLPETKIFKSTSQFQKYWLSRVNHLFFRASKPFRRTNPDFFTKNGKKSNFGPFSSSPVNAGCSRYPVVYVSLISSIQAC